MTAMAKQKRAADWTEVHEREALAVLCEEQARLHRAGYAQTAKRLAYSMVTFHLPNEVEFHALCQSYGLDPTRAVRRVRDRAEGRIVEETRVEWIVQQANGEYITGSGADRRTQAYRWGEHERADAAECASRKPGRSLIRITTTVRRRKVGA